jgi:putative transcription factor
MPCEMCGKEVPRLRKVQIGGSELEVCAECARFGQDVQREAPKGTPVVSGPSAVADAPKAFDRPVQKKPRDALSRTEMELAEDYPRRISKSRQKRGLTQEDLAKRLNEKKSVISRLETGEMRPSDRLIKKLERELDIKLRERVEYQVESTKKQLSSGGVTLGDLIRMEK